tara:strand:+ start:3111 stop:4286 length:1176 start_codon:yes stop_codon:yes gene_type:complete
MAFFEQDPTVDNFQDGHDEIIIARVIDIIMDDQHEDYKIFDGPDAIGMILYRPIDYPTDTSDSGEELYTGRAYPFNPNFNTFPLKNEIVYIIKGPSNNLADGGKNDIDYYTTVINLWNHPHVNLYPVYSDGEPDSVNIGEGMDYLSNIAPVQPYPGDTLIQGRLGTSIRLSGGQSKKNPYATEENKNKPFMIFSNGITNTNFKENGFDFINENVDKDPSSMYLTSNQIIPITLANSKRDSYDDIPDSTSSYKDSQLIGNADRIVLNAKKNDVLISGERSVGINSNTINIDGEDYLCIDAPKIFIGRQARTKSNKAKQPIVLGHELENFLRQLIGEIGRLSRAMGSAKGDRGGPLPLLNKTGIASTKVFRALYNRLNPDGGSELKSKKSFVE